MAGESGEPALMKAFEVGEDVHRATAALMLGKPLDKITDDDRDIGKTMNFALLYGMFVSGLADRLGISKEAAQDLYDRYFASFSAIGSWIAKVKVEGERLGYTISKFGRKFTIHQFKSSNPKIYSKGERLCVNAPIQGGAADYMKIAMVRQRKALVKAGLLDKVHLVMNNHDALTYEVHKSVQPGDVIRVVDPAVTFAVEGFPKIVAEWSVSTRSWGDMRDLELLEDGSVRLAGEYSKEEVIDFGSDPEDTIVEFTDATLPTLKLAVLDRPTQERSDDPVQDHELPQGTAFHDLPDAEPARVIVEVEVMPYPEQFERFQSFLSEYPGHNTVVLSTPEGELELPMTSSLLPLDSARVSMILGAAKTYLSSESVSPDTVLKGLEL